MSSHFRNFAAIALAAGTAVALAAPASAFVTFESGQVRPLAKSGDGNLLFACNTPDNRLEIFDISGGGMVHVSSVPVGLEPVAVAARPGTDEVWVVNHLSDSVSVIDVSDLAAPRVVRSLLVGDEPRDIVFAGLAFDHAYITTAHRGQNIGFDPQFTTAGIGRADVWVFDANNLGASFGGEKETVLTLFGDTPRPLAVNADGSRVYAGVFFSGNQTTVVGEGLVPNTRTGTFGTGSVIMPRPAMALPLPDTDVHGDRRPEVGLIVKWDGTKWTDELDRNWTSSVKFNLPDYDVFAIDSQQDPPVQVAGTPGRFPHVGTTLFNMAVHPIDGKVFVTNLEAFNEVRFEGPGVFAPTTVRGHLVESRITVIDPGTETVTPRHLNKHIDYDSPFDAAPNATNAKSLAFPLDLVFSADGSKLYVAAFGSGKVGTYTTANLVNDSFVPSEADQIAVTGGGPSGLVLDEANSRLFVMTRFDNSISVVNTTMNVESDHVSLHNPEPARVVEGRRFLYDAKYTSSRGDQACASCHIFGDFDALAWDLGNPDDETLHNPSPLIIEIPGPDPDFHPMKGPMTTQSLRGMDNHGPMHWRGDRTGGNDEASAQPDHGIYNEQAAFKKFNGAFTGLIGRSAQLTTEEMQQFTDFVLEVMYPPNPVRNLDDSLTPEQQAAQNIYFGRNTDTLRCNSCHVLNRSGNPTVTRPGFFGSDGRSTFENETQYFKVAHLRNVYQKVGMFGNADTDFLNAGDNGHKGDQIRGFGMLHDGAIDTVFRFFQATVFNPNFQNVGFLSDTERRHMESLMLAFDSNHRPIVGQQATLSSTSGTDATDRVDLLLDRADAGDCDVVVKGLVGGEARGWVYDGNGEFRTDGSANDTVADATLRGYAATVGQDLTFTAVPVGEGRRIGIDRDLDGFGDFVETDAGSDPADLSSLPCSSTDNAFVFRKAALIEKRGRLQIVADLTGLATFDADTIGVQASDGDGMIFTGTIDPANLVVNNAGTVWKYKAAKGTQGIIRMVIKARKTPGDYRVVLKTDAAWAMPGADETIATTNVTLNIVTECFAGAATVIR